MEAPGVEDVQGEPGLAGFHPVPTATGQERTPSGVAPAAALPVTRGLAGSRWSNGVSGGESPTERPAITDGRGAVAAGLAAAQARWRADGDARALRRQLLALLQRLDAFDSRGR